MQPDDDLDPTFVDAGFQCAALIADPHRWINRRVETVEMLSQEETRRRVSVDFTLSPEQQAALATRHGQVVPISVLSKDPRRNFDLRDEQDAADFRQIIFGDEAAALDALETFVAAAEDGERIPALVWEDPVCHSLLLTFVADYVLFAALPVDGPARRVLKYSYGEDLRLEPPWERGRDRYAWRELWWRAGHPGRTRFLVDCAGAWRAASFHMEIAIPEELRVAYADLHRVARGGSEADMARPILGP